MVQLYIRRPVASRSRPLRELKAFEKVAIKAGESRIVRFRVEAAQFGFHDDDGRYVTEPGEVEIYLGGSSQATAKALLRLTKS